MPQAGLVVDVVLNRVRDAGASGASRALVLSILSETQRIANLLGRYVIQTTTLNTVANKQVYRISSELSGAARVLNVTEGGRDLSEVRWQSLFALDRNWRKTTNSRFELWAVVGRELLIVHPAKTTASSVDVSHVKLLDPLTSETQATELDDEELVEAIEFAVILLLLRQRTFAPIGPTIENLTRRLQLQP